MHRLSILFTSRNSPQEIFLRSRILISDDNRGWSFIQKIALYYYELVI